MNKKCSTYLVILMVSFLFLQCNVSEPKEVDLETQLIGEWESQYEILSDGSKSYDNPYALLEFEYSDGFILKADNFGSTVWYDEVKDNYFEWEATESKLIISLVRSDNTIETFEFQIYDLEETSMLFESPKGHTYFMTKK